MAIPAACTRTAPKDWEPNIYQRAYGGFRRERDRVYWPLPIGDQYAGMGYLGAFRHIGQCARLLVLGLGGLALANCSRGEAGRIDPRYGVAASPRVVEPGQPVPKGGGVYRVGKPYTVAGRVYVPEENTQLQRESAWPRGTATISTAATPRTAKSST